MRLKKPPYKGVTILRGQIWRRGPNCFAVILYLGVDPTTHKERRKWIHFSSRREAEAHLVQLAAAPTGAGVGPAGSTRLRLGDFLRSWLDNGGLTVRPRTLKRYGECVTLHITPALGHFPLARIGPQTIQQYYFQKLKAGLSPATVRYHHVVLNQAFRQAVEWDLVAKNPCERVRAPIPAKREPTLWTEAQSRSFLAYIQGHSLAPLFTVMLYTGMRLGEVVSLDWQDVDLERGLIRVVRRTKTRNSVRTIDIPAPAVEAIHSLPHRDGRVFSYHPSYIYHAFVRLSQKAGLPRIRPHDLRHCHATYLLQRQVNPKVVQERLGHHSPAFTLQVYGHVIPGMQREASRTIGEVLH